MHAGHFRPVVENDLHKTESTMLPQAKAGFRLRFLELKQL
jgi:hypothetical protein